MTNLLGLKTTRQKVGGTKLSFLPSFLPSIHFLLNSFFILSLFFTFFQLNSPALANEETRDFQAPIPKEEVYVFDQVGSKISTQEGGVKGVSTAISSAKLKLVKIAVPLWEEAGLGGLLAIGGLGILIWLYFHLRYRHEKDRWGKIEVGEHPHHEHFAEIRFKLWLLKHLPLRLQPGYVQEHNHRPYTFKDNLLVLIFHPVFKALRYAVLLWMIFNISLGSMGWYFLTKGTLPVFAATFADDTKAEFDAGTYSGTQWDATNNWVELSSPPTSGNYTSKVMDAGGNIISWDNIAWVPERPTGKELPNNAASETAYTSGNANMTGNVLLMHMNEASGTIEDTSGNDNDGGLINGALYSQSGKFNTAIGFNANNADYINITKDISSYFSDEATLIMWIKLNNHAPANWGESGIALLGTSGADSHYPAVGGDIHLDIFRDDRLAVGQPAGQLADRTQWHMLTVTNKPGANNWKLYQNDVEIYSSTGEDSIHLPSVSKIGKSVSAYYLNGTLDEVAIYNRALSATEVADHYKRGALKLKYQVRSGTTNPPTGSFVGPDGTTGGYYKWGTTNSTGTPSFNLTNVSANQYFQYKSYFETATSSYTPELKSVTVDYTANEAPNTPTNSSPVNGVTGQDLNVGLSTSAFSDSDAGDTHVDTGWQVDDDSDFSSPVWTRSGTAETSTTVNSTNGAFANELSGETNLGHSTTYYWRVRYSDGVAGWSSWSTATSFTTAQPPSAPINSSPNNGAINQTSTLTLTSSAFSDSDAGASHTASQWQITATSGDYSSPAYDSGTDTSNLTSITVPSGNLNNNQVYYWHVRHRDEINLWSDYSSGTSLTVYGTLGVVAVPGSTEYKAGETASFLVQLKDTDNNPVNSEATVTITIFSPSRTKLINAASMTYTTGSNGIYYYDYTVPETTGVYTYDITATYNSQTNYSSHTFHVAAWIVDITSIKSTIEGLNNISAADVWSYSNRVLTANDNLNNISAADVWSYANRSLTDPDSIWEYALTSIGDTGSIGKLLKDNIDASVSSRSSHTAADVWDVVTRTLTSNANFNDPTTAEITAALWAADSRTLTNYGNDITAADVWNALTSTLTTANSIGKLLVDNINATISSRGTSNLTATDVWNAATRTLTSSENFNDPTAAAVAQAVWTEANRTLTNYGNNITAAEVWDVLASSLTTVGSIGKQMAENVDVAVSSRASAEALAEHETAQVTSRTKVADIQTRVTAVQSDVSTIKSDVSTIKSDVSSAKSTIDSIWSRLQTLAGTLPSGYTGVYEQLVSIANTLRGLGVLKGSGADSLYSLSVESKDDVKYLKNKILDMQAAIEINRILLASGGQNSVFSTWYTFHSVVLNMLIANPTNRAATIPFKAYLPKEAKQEHIISSGGLKIEYDEAAGSYVALGEFELEGGESIIRQVEMKDIWLIDEGELDNLKKQTEELANEAKKTAYSAQVVVLKNDTLMRLERILRKQKDATATPQDHILAFRENQEDLAVVKENLKKMTDLVTSVGAGRGLLASVAGINAFVAWGIIIALVTGVGLLGFMFYSMWKHQMLIVAQLAGKKIEGEVMGTIAAGVGVPALISLPKIKWDIVLPRLKKIFLILVVGGIVFGVIKDTTYFKPWERLRKQEQPAVMAPVESEKKAIPSPLPTPTPEPKKVVILETETGWLNVREGPGISFDKVTRVGVGEEFVELGREINEAGEEWVKIKVDEKTEGWVLGKYAKEEEK